MTPMYTWPKLYRVGPVLDQFRYLLVYQQHPHELQAVSSWLGLGEETNSVSKCWMEEAIDLSTGWLDQSN